MHLLKGNNMKNKTEAAKLDLPVVAPDQVEAFFRSP